MTGQEIDELRNFTWNEKDVFGRHIFERHEEIDWSLMKWIDNFVEQAKRLYGFKLGRFIVNDINQGAHSDGSLHYEGKAIDGHFVGLSLAQTGLLALADHWMGIGLYPEWYNPGVHLDIRDEGKGVGERALWVQRGGEYLYHWDTFERVITGRE